MFKNKKVTISLDFQKTDLLIIILVLLEMVLKIAVPDTSYDVAMYHIYQQEFPFIDKINFDFFPGRTLNSYLFPLGDRIFYLSRYLLGFRLGTILSYYCIIILFYQIKELTNNILENKNNKVVSLLSSLIFFEYTIYYFTGIYYIDLFSAVFIMELICLIFQKEEINKSKLYFIFLIMGISIGIKVPNLLAVIPIFIYFVFKNRKKLFLNLKIKDIFICIILFFIPYFVYVIFNILQTGSPIYPYYNSFFKSKWFDNINWKDTRWGAPNIFYALIWSVMPAVDPSKTSDEGLWDVSWGIGYIILLVYLLVLFIRVIVNKNKKNIKNMDIVLLTFVLSIDWAMFLYGYMRYALFLPALHLVIFEIVVLDEISKIKNVISIVSFSTIIDVSIILTISTVLHSLVNNIYYFHKNSGYYYNEAQEFFKDKNFEKIHIDGAWVTLSDDSKLVTLVREEDTPIYYLESRFLLGNNAKKKQQELKQKNLYTIIDDSNRLKKIDELDNENLEIDEIIYDNLQFKFLPSWNKAIVCKLKYNSNNEEVVNNNSEYRY